MLVQRLQTLGRRAQSTMWCLTILITITGKSPAFWGYYLRTLHFITKFMLSYTDTIFNVFGSITYVPGPLSPG